MHILESFRTKVDQEPVEKKELYSLPDSCLERRGFLCPVCLSFWVFHVYIRKSPFIIHCDCSFMCLFLWETEEILLKEGYEGIKAENLEFLEMGDELNV